MNDAALYFLNLEREERARKKAALAYDSMLALEMGDERETPGEECCWKRNRITGLPCFAPFGHSGPCVLI